MGLYPVGAMVNHSCTPNAMQSFAGRRIVFRAIRPIAAGDEVTISYVELAATRAERRAALLAGYCFDIDAGRVRHVSLQLTCAVTAVTIKLIQDGLSLRDLCPVQPESQWSMVPCGAAESMLLCYARVGSQIILRQASLMCVVVL